MLNPYAILVALLATLFIAFGGYRYGKQVCQGEQATAIATAQNEAIAAANRDTEAATVRAVAQAKAEAGARLAATTIRLRGERDAAIKARPECARDSESHRLLVESIAHANGLESSSGSMSYPLPATPGARQQ